jgi:ankyrin repeat protein
MEKMILGSQFFRPYPFPPMCIYGFITIFLPRCTKTLLELKSDPNFLKTQDGKTPLHYAAQYGSTDVAQLLVDHGGDAAAKDFNDVTPLHEAAENGFKEIVELLVRNGADLDATNVKGKTPFDLAVERGNESCVEQLAQFKDKQSKQLLNVIHFCKT